ncbi:MAG: hypothetical protein F2840_09315 [Actinobacteria bacterium]|nr:hypothetical protein [Actinomycetota bacterium]
MLLRRTGCPPARSYVAEFTDNLLRVFADLMDRERSTGRRAKLVLEPEPCCFLGTNAETVEYFNTHVCSAVAYRRVAELTGQPLSEFSGACAGGGAHGPGGDAGDRG